MNYLVTRSTLEKVLAHLRPKEILAWDCETTGLNSYQNAEMFSLAIADLEGNAYYFNFKDYPSFESEIKDYVLEPSDLRELMHTPRTWIAHNAKFDLHFTAKDGIKPHGRIFDTEILARLYENHHQFKGGYSLAACAERWLSVRKDDRVKKWMDENGAFSGVPNAEGTKTNKHYYFDLVPFEIISEYACQDVVVTAQLYQYLTERMYETEAVETEVSLTPVLFEIEKHGLKIDRAYCQKAYKYEQERAQRAGEHLESLCPGWTDSAKFLSHILIERGFTLPTTDKGNYQITDEVLSQKPDDELAKLLLQYRDATKRATTYWSNYLFLSDANDVLHPNFRQAGTVTGRMSCDNPNLQNIPSEDEGPYPIRRAFVPRPGCVFVSIDYAQMEFRLMLEYARQMDLIEKIKQGHDPHDSTAELTGLSRKAAKTLNFGLLYGMGVARLAKAIGVGEHEARDFKYRYFERLPGVRSFIRESSRRMEARGFTFNWAGRRYQLEDAKWSYKAANAIIQGGCAEIAKQAMVRLADFLDAHPSLRMVLQVHDEVLFEVPLSEVELVQSLREIMESSYQAKHMPLACSVSVGKNFHDMAEIADIAGLAEAVTMEVG